MDQSARQTDSLHQSPHKHHSPARTGPCAPQFAPHTATRLHPPSAALRSRIRSGSVAQPSLMRAVMTRVQTRWRANRWASAWDGRRAGGPLAVCLCCVRVDLLRVETLLHLQHLFPLLQQSRHGRHMFQRQRHGQILVRAGDSKGTAAAEAEQKAERRQRCRASECPSSALRMLPPLVPRIFPFPLCW